MRKTKETRLPLMCKEVSLRPYPASLFACYTKEAYLKTYKLLLGDGGEVPDNSVGRFAAGNAECGRRVYIVWAETPWSWAHEVSHVLIDLMPKLGFDLNDCVNDEAFCYMMSAVLEDIITTRLKR